jgi:hypothetical protein
MDEEEIPFISYAILTVIGHCIYLFFIFLIGLYTISIVFFYSLRSLLACHKMSFDRSTSSRLTFFPLYI